MAYHDVYDYVLTEYHPWMSSIYFNADKTMLEIAETVSRLYPNIYFGRMVTGESFIENDARDSINQKFSPLSVDMETASIAHVCYVNEIPFIAIRSVTDTADNSGTQNFEKNCMQAAIIAKHVTLHLLNELIKRIEIPQ